MTKRILKQKNNKRTSLFLLAGVFMFIFLTGCNMGSKDTEVSLLTAKEFIPLSLVQQGYDLEKVKDKKYDNESFYTYQLVFNNELLDSYILVSKDLDNTFLMKENKKIEFAEIENDYEKWEGMYNKAYPETEEVDNCFSNLIITSDNGKVKLNFDSYYGRGQVKFETLLDLKDRYTTESYYFDTGDSFYLKYLNENEISINIKTVKDIITNETIDINEEYSENIIEDLTLRREEERLMFSGIFYKS